VDLTGIEPVTSSMPWKRAPSCATGPLLGKDFPYSQVSGSLSQTRRRRAVRHHVSSGTYFVEPGTNPWGAGV
jgi:hypothetical protein